ncbi:MAG: helix-turn-helix domain-containing protein [Candidatus Omnitrophica bacterium]|nr:helix-turn-helix domain-containing protein [Candidatus Omnitrophota bacterium]
MIKKRTQYNMWDMVAESLEDLSRVKDVTTSMRQLDELKYPAPKEYTARDIRHIREKLHVSQAVFAHLLNTKLTTVQKWERGVNTPAGPASRLLQIFESKIKKQRS